MCRPVQADLHGENQSEIREVRGYTTDDQTCTRRLVRNPEPTVEKKPQFEIDLRVEGVSQDTFLQVEEKMKQIHGKVGKVLNGIMCKIHT